MPKVTTELKPELEIKAKQESEPIVINEPQPESEIEKPLVELSTNLLAEFAMELVPSSPPVVMVSIPLKLPDVYDPLQIFLEATGSQEFRFFMMQSTIDPVSSGMIGLDILHVPCSSTIDHSRLVMETSSTSTALV